MATPRTIEVKVSRKISKDYNSTEYSASVTLDLTEAEAKVPNKVPALIEEWAEKLRDTIRQEFARSNTKAALNGHAPAPAPVAAGRGANGHAH
jgi:hypothetical protein